MVALAVSRSFALPTAVILPLTATTVSESRIGLPMSPLNRSPMLWITSRAGATDSLACPCAIRHLPQQIFDARQYTDRLGSAKTLRSSSQRIAEFEVWK